MVNTPAHEVPKDVESVEVGHLAASVDVTSRHRLSQLMGVGEYRQDVIWGWNSTLVYTLLDSAVLFSWLILKRNPKSRVKSHKPGQEFK